MRSLYSFGHWKKSSIFAKICVTEVIVYVLAKWVVISGSIYNVLNLQFKRRWQQFMYKFKCKLHKKISLQVRPTNASLLIILYRYWRDLKNLFSDPFVCSCYLLSFSFSYLCSTDNKLLSYWVNCGYSMDKSLTDHVLHTGQRCR